MAGKTKLTVAACFNANAICSFANRDFFMVISPKMMTQFYLDFSQFAWTRFSVAGQGAHVSIYEMPDHGISIRPSNVRDNRFAASDCQLEGRQVPRLRFIALLSRDFWHRRDIFRPLRIQRRI